MKLASLLLIFLLLAGISCKKEIADQQLITSAATVGKQTVDMNKELKIAIVSDIHYMSPNLLTTAASENQAFQEYIAMDPKLLEFIEPIFQNVITNLVTQKPDLILMPGDLTKDGELVSHQDFKTLLDNLQTALPSTKIYVIPGNHDINNPEATIYGGTGTSKAETIQKEQFKTLYQNYGYSNTGVSQDANSLSYLAKPYDNVWILGIDANKYEQNTSTTSTVSGEIKASTLEWITGILKDAKNQGATVLPMMHHNLIEHFAGQSVLDPGFTIDNWQTVANELLAAGMNVIFTGHYHANDITTFKHNGQELVDIETGSLVNPPLPYRIIMLKNKSLDVNTLYVTLPGTYGGMTFREYSTTYMTNLFAQRFAYYLAPYFGGDPSQVPQEITMLFANSYMAHYAGDEQMPVDMRKYIAQVNKLSPDLAAMLNSLWSDINTKDNFGPITLQSR